MKLTRTIATYLFIQLLLLCSPTYAGTFSGTFQNWTLVYETDINGNVLRGDFTSLKNAVIAGSSIRAVASSDGWSSLIHSYQNPDMAIIQPVGGNPVVTIRGSAPVDTNVVLDGRQVDYIIRSDGYSQARLYDASRSSFLGEITEYRAIKWYVNN